MGLKCGSSVIFPFLSFFIYICPFFVYVPISFGILFSLSIKLKCASVFVFLCCLIQSAIGWKKIRGEEKKWGEMKIEK